MVESAMDHPICLGCTAAQTSQIINITPVHLSAGISKKFGARIRPGKPQHLMTRLNKIRHND